MTDKLPAPVPGWTHGLRAANANKPLANLTSPEQVLGPLRAGQTPYALAEELGISHQSLYEWLLRNHPDEWRAISAARSLRRLETAEQDIDASRDQVQVSRARESFKMGAWHLERVARAMYGQDTNSGGVQVVVNVQRGDSTD